MGKILLLRGRQLGQIISVVTKVISLIKFKSELLVLLTVDENEIVFTYEQGNYGRCLNLRCGLEHWGLLWVKISVSCSRVNWNTLTAKPIKFWLREKEGIVMINGEIIIEAKPPGTLVSALPCITNILLYELQGSAALAATKLFPPSFLCGWMKNIWREKSNI